MRAARVPGLRAITIRGEAQLADAAGEGVPRGPRARDGIERARTREPCDGCQQAETEDLIRELRDTEMAE